MKIYTSSTEKCIEITDQEIQDLISQNEPEDVIGVEEDLLALIKSKQQDSVSVSLRIRSLDPFRLRIMVTNNKSLLT